MFKLILKATAENFVFLYSIIVQIDEFLTADTEEIPLGTCYRDTGGTCRFFSCATSRGEAGDRGSVIQKDQNRWQMMARIARSARIKNGQEYYGVLI